MSQNDAMPYFVAAGLVNYAPYGICHLRTINKLPGTVLEQFIKGEHVVRHQDEQWNGIWTDKMIEDTREEDTRPRR